MTKSGGRIKILMVGPALTVKGGMTTLVEIYKAHWDEDTFRLRYVGIYVDGSKLNKLWVAVLAMLRFIYLQLVWHPQITHIHFSHFAGFYRESLFILVAHVMNRPTIIHAHGGFFDEFYRQQPAILQGYIRHILSIPHTLIALSSYWRDYFQQLRQRDTVMLYNPVSLPSEITHFRRHNVVLTLGRLGHGKGTFDSLQAMPQLLSCQPDVELWLGGDGDVEQVRIRLHEETWGNQVSVLGWVGGEDKHRLLSEATLFLLPSYQEGLPFAILEAMAYGLPVVATSVGGIPEAVRNGENGILVQPGDIEAISAALRQLLTDPELRLKMGARGQAIVRDQFEVTAILPRLYALYHAIHKQAENRRDD